METTEQASMKTAPQALKPEEQPKPTAAKKDKPPDLPQVACGGSYL